MKTFEAEPQSFSIFGLDWNVDTDSLIVCRGPGREIPAKTTQRTVLFFVSVVFDPPGISSHFTIRMRFLLKTIRAAIDNCETKSCQKEQECSNFETSHLQRRVRRSNLHFGISARRGHNKTYLCDRKMPRSTYQTKYDYEFRFSRCSQRNLTKKADFENMMKKLTKFIIRQIYLQCNSGYSQLTRNNKYSLPTGHQKY